MSSIIYFDVFYPIMGHIRLTELSEKNTIIIADVYFDFLMNSCFELTKNEVLPELVKMWQMQTGLFDVNSNIVRISPNDNFISTLNKIRYSNIFERLSVHRIIKKRQYSIHNITESIILLFQKAKSANSYIEAEDLP